MSGGTERVSVELSREEAQMAESVIRASVKGHGDDCELCALRRSAAAKLRAALEPDSEEDD